MIKKYLQYTEWDIGEKKLVLCVNNRLNRKNARICFKKSENNLILPSLVKFLPYSSFTLKKHKVVLINDLF